MRSLSVENSLWKRLQTCHKTDNEISNKLKLYLKWTLSVYALSILITATIISETLINISAAYSITSETISTATEVWALQEEQKYIAEPRTAKQSHTGIDKTWGTYRGVDTVSIHVAVIGAKFTLIIICTAWTTARLCWVPFLTTTHERSKSVVAFPILTHVFFHFTFIHIWQHIIFY